MIKDTGDIVQKVRLGVDAGTKHIGISATTLKYELLAMEILLRTDITKNLAVRREYRRTRRNRLRHRKPRFNNRGKKGWIASSIKGSLWIWILPFGVLIIICICMAVGVL